MVFKWLGQPLGKKRQKTRQLWEREFNIVDGGLDEEQVTAFVDELIANHRASQEAYAASIRSIIQKATVDAQQMAANIKLKAQEAAEDERERIIEEAKQEAEEIRRRAEGAAQKEAEDVLSVANRKAETSEAEAKQKALLFFFKVREKIAEDIGGDYKRSYSQLLSSLHNLISEGQDIEAKLKGERAELGRTLDRVFETVLLGTSGEAAPAIETSTPIESEIAHDVASPEKEEKPVQLQEAPAAPEAVEKPVQLQEAPAAPEVVETASESRASRAPEERPVIETTSVPVEDGYQSLYAGELELYIAAPVDVKMVSELYNSLQTMSQIKILHTRGSREKGTVVTIMIEKPTPLIALVSKVDGLEAKLDRPSTDDSVKGKGHFLLGKTKREGARRIVLTYKSKGNHSG